MANKRVRYVLGLLTLAVLIAAWVFLGTHHCPADGLAFTAERRAFHRLKNRTALPQETDFDARVTLESLLQPGNDQARWSTVARGADRRLRCLYRRGGSRAGELLRAS